MLPPGPDLLLFHHKNRLSSILPSLSQVSWPKISRRAQNGTSSTLMSLRVLAASFFRMHDEYGEYRTSLSDCLCTAT